MPIQRDRGLRPLNVKPGPAQVKEPLAAGGTAWVALRLSLLLSQARQGNVAANSHVRGQGVGWPGIDLWSLSVLPWAGVSLDAASPQRGANQCCLLAPVHRQKQADSDSGSAQAPWESSSLAHSGPPRGPWNAAS